MCQRLRLDKWLWVARFFKTRPLAADAIKGGKIEVDGQQAKASQQVGAGNMVRISKGQQRWTVEVQGVSPRRGPASAAQELYHETEESRAERERLSLINKLQPSLHPEQRGAPDKHQRRELLAFKRGRGGH